MALTHIKQSHCSTVFIVNYEHITPSSGVSIFDFEYVFFSEFDLIFQLFLD